MSHLVSIVMPSYNAGAYIAEAIGSVLGQTYADWELLVVDDGSTDDTAGVVGTFSGQDARIRYLRRENGGQAAARNTGIGAARGELVAFLDADDLWEPEKLALQVRALEETGADFVLSDAVIFAEGGEAVTSFSEICEGFLYGRHEGAEAFRLLFAYNRIPTLTVLARKARLYEAGLFDERVGRCFPGRNTQVCEDYDLWLRLARRGAVFYGMREKLARYRRHAASATHRESTLLKPWIDVLKAHADALGREEARPRIRDLYRQLVTTLLREGDLAGARRSMREFAAWDGGLVTACQRVLLRLSPRSFNRVSRRCLYPVEWRVSRLMEKLRAA